MAITEPSVGQSNWGPVLNTALTQLDTIGASNGYHTQTVASATALTIDASTGQFQNVLLQAAPTSWTISNGEAGQVIHIQFTQDGTGGHNITTAPAATLKFVAGAFSLTGTANKSQSIVMGFDGTNWREISRSSGEV